MNTTAAIYHWADTYDRAVSLYHGPAHPDTERQILEHFNDNPRRVVDAIEHVGEAVKRGEIRSGWGVLTKRLADLKAREQLIARDTSGRARTIENTERWITTAGCLMPWHEVIAELFGPPEFTPPAELLLQLEIDTRDRPGRPLYDGLLKACIRRTMDEGPQVIPDTGGRIRQYDTTELRQHLHDVWTAAANRHAKEPKAA